MSGSLASSGAMALSSLTSQLAHTKRPFKNLASGLTAQLTKSAERVTNMIQYHQPP